MTWARKEAQRADEFVQRQNKICHLKDGGYFNEAVNVMTIISGQNDANVTWLFSLLEYGKIWKDGYKQKKTLLS